MFACMKVDKLKLIFIPEVVKLFIIIKYEQGHLLGWILEWKRGR